jgi:mono/diheme cytochrome c family protein
MLAPLSPSLQRWIDLLPMFALLPVALSLAACTRGAAGASSEKGAPSIAATLVGGQVCSGCHAREAELWRGSHHDLAMQEATPETLAGAFATASPEEGLPAAVSVGPSMPSGSSGDGGSTRAAFLRRGGVSFVRTLDADGREHELPVAYAFGVEPLQQLLLPAHGG